MSMMAAKLRAPAFKLEIPGDNDFKGVFRAKIDQIRDRLAHTLQSPVNNAIILETVMDYWLAQQQHDVPHLDEGVNMNIDLLKKDTHQDMYVMSRDSVDTVLTIKHARFCPGNLSVITTHHRGHVALCKVRCSANKGHVYWWSSSSRLPNNKYLVNERIQHALICSGIIPVKYSRFASEAGFGEISAKTRREFLDSHKDSIETVYQDSLSNAMRIRYYTVQCSEDQTSAVQGSLRQGKLKYNASSGQIWELEKND